MKRAIPDDLMEMIHEELDRVHEKESEIKPEPEIDPELEQLRRECRELRARLGRYESVVTPPRLKPGASRLVNDV